MATKGKIEVRLDVTRLDSLSDKLGEIDGRQLGIAAVRAVNEVTDRVYDTARKRMNAGINLTDQYLRDNMQVIHADDPARPRAVIRARFRATTLGRYDARQLVQPAKRPDRAKGDSLRGIPPGLKQAGVSVEVARGARKPVLGTRAFLVPLKNGNGMGVFVREGAGKKNIRHLYAPSVYQLFRKAVEVMYEDIGGDLEAAIAREAERELERILS